MNEGPKPYPVVYDAEDGLQYSFETGYVAIVVPTPTDITVGDIDSENSTSGKVITSNGDGTASWATGTGSAPTPNSVQAHQTTTTSITSSTYTTTGLAASITPASASYKIRVTISGTLRNDDGADAVALVTVKRGSTDIAPDTGSGLVRLTDPSGSTLSLMASPYCVSFIDSPATTSSTTYTVFVKNSDNTTAVAVFGPQIINVEEMH